MSKTPKEYTKLSGGGLRNGEGRFFAITRSSCRLWLGSDHVLLAERTGYTETYKRFYFRDIQAILIRKTKTAAVWNGILGGIALILFAIGLAVTDLNARIPLWIFAGLFGILMLINLLRGSSCVTHVKTAVQTEEWPAWRRLRTARKGKQQIRARLLEAQREIPADELRVRLEDIVRSQTEGSSPNVF